MRRYSEGLMIAFRSGMKFNRILERRGEEKSYH